MKNLYQYNFNTVDENVDSIFEVVAQTKKTSESALANKKIALKGKANISAKVNTAGVEGYISIVRYMIEDEDKKKYWMYFDYERNFVYFTDYPSGTKTLNNIDLNKITFFKNKNFKMQNGYIKITSNEIVEFLKNLNDSLGNKTEEAQTTSASTEKTIGAPDEQKTEKPITQNDEKTTAQTILSKFQEIGKMKDIKITDIDLQNPNTKNLNALYLIYLTKLISAMQQNQSLAFQDFIKDTTVNKVIEKIKTVNAKKTKKGLPPIAFIDKDINAIATALNLDKKIIKKLIKNKAIYFEQEIDNSFYKDLKNPNIFFEKYL